MKNLDKLNMKNVDKWFLCKDFGDLLNQYELEDVVSIEWDNDTQEAIITFEDYFGNKSIKRANCNFDSGLQMILDICKCILR